LTFGGCLPAALSLVASGCGAAGSSTRAAAAVQRVSLAVVSPASPFVTGSTRVTIRGIVSPPQARVTIEGVPVAVAGGLFVVSLPLPTLRDTLHVVASAPPAQPASATLLVLRRTHAHASHTAAGTAQASAPSTGVVAGGNEPAAVVRAEHVHIQGRAGPPTRATRTAPTNSPAPHAEAPAGAPSSTTPATGVTIPKAEAPPEHAEREQAQAEAEGPVSIPKPPAE
jgi:hypothetical protein